MVRVHYSLNSSLPDEASSGKLADGLPPADAARIRRAIAADPQATYDSVISSPEGVGRGIMAHSPYFTNAPAGLYRALLRAKVAKNTGDKDTPILEELCALDSRGRFLGCAGGQRRQVPHLIE